VKLLAQLRAPVREQLSFSYVQLTNEDWRSFPKKLFEWLTLETVSLRASIRSQETRSVENSISAAVWILWWYYGRCHVGNFFSRRSLEALNSAWQQSWSASTLQLC
jgi:hypothetical protein